MKRRLDWPERLNDELDVARQRAFSDAYYCGAFEADVILAMTDEDPIAELRGLGVAETYKAIREAGHETTRAYALSKLGEEVHVAFAQRGDVVVRQVEGVDAMGICCGQLSAFIGPDGLVFVPTIEQATAFRVP